MHALGQQLGAQLRAGDLVLLTGPLGAGKTTLTRGIGDGLNVRGPVTESYLCACEDAPLAG